MTSRHLASKQPVPSRAGTVRWRKRIVVAVTASVLLGPGSTSSASVATEGFSDPGVCAGVSGCRVMARADVNGDGSGDVIGMARRGADGAADGAVIVRVKTGPGRIASVRARIEYWYGSLWQGVAHLDGRKGKEIVVGQSAGAHAQFYRALTWRQGDLVTLDAPGKGKYWYVDGAVWISAGWQRRVGDPVGTIRRRVAIRTGDATQSPFKGTVTTFRWAAGGWNKIASRTVYPLADDRAYGWGGFRVSGLRRW